MGRLETLAELAINPKFRALSPEARAIVLERREPAFAELSPEARAVIAQRFDQPAVRELGATATPRGALQALGVPMEPPGVLERAAEWATRDDVSNLRGPDIASDEQGGPVWRGPVAEEYRGTVPGFLSDATGFGFDSVAEDVRRGPAAVLDRLSLAADEFMHPLAAGGSETVGSFAHTLANAIDLATPEPIMTPEEFDELAKRGAWPQGTPPEEIARRRREFTEPSSIGGYARAVSSWLRDASEAAYERGAAHVEATPSEQGMIEPTSSVRASRATLRATAPGVGMAAELSPFFRIAGVTGRAAPVVGMAAHGAVSRADEGPEAAAEAAAHGAALGAGMAWIERSGTGEAVRRLASAGMFGADSAAAGAATEDVLAAAITGGLLMTPRPEPQPRVDPRLQPQGPTFMERAADFAERHPRALEAPLEAASLRAEPAPPLPALPPGELPRDRLAERRAAEVTPERPDTIELGTGRQPSPVITDPIDRFQVEVARIWGAEGFEAPVDLLSLPREVAQRIELAEREAYERARAEVAEQPYRLQELEDARNFRIEGPPEAGFALEPLDVGHVEILRQLAGEEGPGLRLNEPGPRARMRDLIERGLVETDSESGQVAITEAGRGQLAVRARSRGSVADQTGSQRPAESGSDAGSPRGPAPTDPTYRAEPGERLLARPLAMAKGASLLDAYPRRFKADPPEEIARYLDAFDRGLAVRALEGDAQAPTALRAELLAHPEVVEALLLSPDFKGKPARELRDWVAGEPDFPMGSVVPSKPPPPPKWTRLEAAGRAMSSDPTRFGLNRVYATGEGTLNATDGHRLHTVRNSGFKPPEGAHGFARGPQGKLVPTSEEASPPHFDQVRVPRERAPHEFTLTPAQSVALLGELKATRRHYGLRSDGKLANSIEVRHGDEVTLLNSAYLLDALEAARAVSPREPLTLRMSELGSANARRVQLDQGDFSAVIMGQRHDPGTSGRVLPRHDWSQYKQQSPAPAPAPKPKKGRGRKKGASNLQALDLAVAEATPNRQGDLEAMGPGENRPKLIEHGEALAPATDATDPSRDPIRRERILADFTQAIGKPIFEGKRSRIKAGGILGYRLVGQGAVRIAKRSDLEVTAHELAHEIDARYPEIEKFYKAKSPAADEMLTTSYDTSKPEEGFAEFVRMYMTQRPLAREVVPKAVEWFEKEFLPKHPELAVPLEKASTDMHAWFRQSPLDQARSKIGEMQDVNKRRLWRRMVDSDFRQTTIDDLEGIARYERLVTGQVNEIGEPSLPAPYRVSRLTRAKHSITSGALEFGAPVWVGKDAKGDEARARHVTGARDEHGRKIEGETFEAAKMPLEARIEYEGKGLLDILNQVEGLDVLDLDGSPWQSERAKLARSGRDGAWQFGKGDKLDAFMLYAIGRRAEVLRSEGRENLFTGQQIADMVRLGEKNPEFSRVLGEYQEFNHRLLDFAEAAGVISPASRDAFQTDVYLPFYREGSGTMKLLGHGGTPGERGVIKRLTGGDANLRDVLDNMLTNTSMLIDAAVTNQARKEIARVARRNGAGDFIEPIGRESGKVKAFEWSVRKQLFDELGWEMPRDPKDPYWAEHPDREALRDGMENLGPVLSLVGPRAPSGERVIAVLEKGRPQYFEVIDDQLYRSVLSLNREPAHAVIRALSSVAQLGKKTIILSPDFMLANATRDTMSAWVYSKHGFKPVVDTWRGMRSRMKKDETYKLFLANGGGFSGYYLEGDYFRRHQADLARFYKSQGINANLVTNTPRRFADFVTNLGDAVEMSSRIGEFKRAIDKGVHPRDAAFDAREVASDFAMRGDRHKAAGEAVNFFYDTVMFLRPAMIGLDRSYRGLTKDAHRRQVAARVVAMVAGGVGLHAWNELDPLGLEDEDLIPEWDRIGSLEDWDRDGHFHVYAPTPSYIAYLGGAGDKPASGPGEAYQHWRIPKPFEVGSMASVAERGFSEYLAATSGAKPGSDALKDLTVHSLRILRNQVRIDPTPTAIEGLLEVGLNRDKFTGRMVESPSIASLEKWRRSSGSGSRLLRSAGEATRNLPTWAQVNPAVAEHLVGAYLNYWGTYGLLLADRALFHDVPDLEPSQYPGLRRFYKGTTVLRTRQLRELGDSIREADMALKTARDLVDTGEREFAREIVEREKAPLYEKLQRLPKPALRQLGAMRRDVQRTSDLAQLQTAAAALAAARPKGQGTYSVKAMKRDGAWTRVSSLKSALLNEIRFLENHVAFRFADELEKEKAQ